MAKKAASRKTARGSKTARKGSAKGTRSAKSARSGGARKASKTTGAKRKSSGGGRGKANAAFMRPVSPSPALAEVVGEKPIPRSEVTKRLWAYIKKNRLQDQKNRRMINADGALKPVFGGKSAVNMFEMTKLVGKHLK
jgi:upstream activation factor subunit UAF30